MPPKGALPPSLTGMWLDEPRPVRALLLAADPGEGFSRPRWLEPWLDGTVLEHVVAAAHDWPVDELVVVLGADADEIAASCSFGEATLVIDPEWAEGEAASLRVGLDVLMRRGSEGPALVADAAITGVRTEDVAALIAGHDRERAPVSVTVYRYASGPPYLVEPELWPRLMGREGDARLDTLWKAHPDWVGEVRVDRLPPRPISTPFELEELRSAR